MTRGDRVAQLVLERIETPAVVEVAELSDTVRGAGGYGSTGVAGAAPAPIAPAATAAAGLHSHPDNGAMDAAAGANATAEKKARVA